MKISLKYNNGYLKIDFILVKFLDNFEDYENKRKCTRNLL